MRPFRFALHLREFGWQPTILTIAAPGQHLTPKEKRLLSGIEIIELRSPFDRTTSSESQLGADKETNLSTRGRSETAPLTRQRTGGITGNVLQTLDRQFPTDTWLLLFASKYPELLRIVKRVKPDILWCTGDPWSGLVAASWLAKHFNLPWAADFRDPWTLSKLRTEGKWAPARRIDELFERRIIESADVVLFQAASVEEAYRRHYRTLDFKSQVILNSFDPGVFDDPIAFDPTPAMPVSTADGLHIGFFGRFRLMSPASVMIDALSAVRRRDPDRAGRIHIHSFGSLNEADAAYAREHGVEACFVREDAVPLEKSLSILRRFDLLLVSTELNRDQIIPAKIFEYLAAGRPILSLSRNPEVGRILQETGTGMQLDPRQAEKVADFLVGCLEASDEERPMPIPFRPNAASINRFEARETTRVLASVFDEITCAPT